MRLAAWGSPIADDVDPRTVVALSLARATGLLPLVFDRRAIKTRKARIEEVVNGKKTGRAAREAIAAMQAAVMVAIMVPMMVTTTSH